MRCIAQTYAAPEADGTKIGTTRRSADFPATGRIRCGEQVCRVTGFQTSGPLDLAHRADLEIGDTAGLENCATILGTPWLFSTRFVLSDYASRETGYGARGRLQFNPAQHASREWTRVAFSKNQGNSVRQERRFLSTRSDTLGISHNNARICRDFDEARK